MAWSPFCLVLPWTHVYYTQQMHVVFVHGQFTRHRCRPGLLGTQFGHKRYLVKDLIYILETGLRVFQRGSQSLIKKKLWLLTVLIFLMFIFLNPTVWCHCPIMTHVRTRKHVMSWGEWKDQVFPLCHNPSPWTNIRLASPILLKIGIPSLEMWFGLIGLRLSLKPHVDFKEWGFTPAHSAWSFCNDGWFVVYTQE